MTRGIAVFVGSLRRDSLSRKTAGALIDLAPGSFRAGIVEIGPLPLYNPDDDEDGNAPETCADFRRRVKAADALLFVTPEYNRSVPAALKNALDVASRTHGQSAWDGKPGAVVSVSAGAIGGFAANHHLRQSLVFLNVPAMPQPEAYVGGAATPFDPVGTLINDATRTFLRRFMDAFVGRVEANARSDGRVPAVVR